MMMPYRRTFYLLRIIIQVFLIIIFVLHFGYVLGRYGSYVPMTDNVIAFIYLGIMLIATIYQFRSPYHETKASIYLALFYF